MAAKEGILYKVTTLGERQVKLYILEHPFEGATNIFITLTIEQLQSLQDLLIDKVAERLRAETTPAQRKD